MKLYTISELTMIAVKLQDQEEIEKMEESLLILGDLYPKNSLIGVFVVLNARKNIV